MMRLTSNIPGLLVYSVDFGVSSWRNRLLQHIHDLSCKHNAYIGNNRGIIVKWLEIRSGETYLRTDDERARKQQRNFGTGNQLTLFPPFF